MPSAPPPPLLPPPPIPPPFFFGQEIRSSGELHLRTYSFRPWNSAALRPVLRHYWNRHATNTSEVRLASVTPSTLSSTGQLRAMTHSCAPRPASRGGHAIAFIIILLTKPLTLQVGACGLGFWGLGFRLVRRSYIPTHTTMGFRV